MGLVALLAGIAALAIAVVVRAGKRRLVPIVLIALAWVGFLYLPDSAGLALYAGLVLGALLLARVRR